MTVFESKTVSAWFTWISNENANLQPSVRGIDFDAPTRRRLASDRARDYEGDGA